MLLQKPWLETSCHTCHAKWPHVFNKNGNKLGIYLRKNRYLGTKVGIHRVQLHGDGYTLGEFHAYKVPG